jgi:hypothetical protein
MHSARSVPKIRAAGRNPGPRREKRSAILGICVTDADCNTAFQRYPFDI